ncbi:MAG: tellurite methyltransferase [Myxococcota bacterium]|jgi:tellurite methyltransferase
MNREIVDFYLDDEGDHAARLSCGHGRHVRHRPPMVSRPWVLTEAGRRGQLGTVLDCLKCDRLELPDDALPYRHTRDFTEQTLPAGLRAEHSTKVGVWGRIEVSAGTLRYRIAVLDHDVILVSGDVGIIPPEMPHSVTPEGLVVFRVVFCRPSSLMLTAEG